MCVCVFWIRRWKEEHEWNESSLHQIAVRGAMAGQCNELQWTATKKNKLKIKHTTVSPAHLANRTKGSSISPMNSNDRETATATEYVMAQLNGYLFIIQFRPFNCLTNMQWSSHRTTHTHIAKMVSEIIDTRSGYLLLYWCDFALCHTIVYFSFVPSYVRAVQTDDWAAYTREFNLKTPTESRWLIFARRQFFVFKSRRWLA